MNTMKFRSIILGACFLLITNSAAIAQFADISDEETETSPIEITTADLRLNQIYPGPGSVHFNAAENQNGFLNTLGSKPGYAFLSSLLVPGLGQAANNNWIRAGIYAAIEATAIAVYIVNENQGRQGERDYMDFAHENFSVIRYAQWMVEYNQLNGRNVSIQDVAAEGYNLMELDYNDFTYEQEWHVISLSALNRLEGETLYYDAGDGSVAFSHYLDDFGTQQYYELISKYFQYGPGWLDWENGRRDPFQLHLSIDSMSPNWQAHARIGAAFNDDLQLARHMISLLLVNHFVSAMDALMSNKLQQHNLQASANYNMGPTFTLGYRF